MSEAPNLKFDPNNRAHAFVVTGMIKMVENDGLTPRQVFQVLEDIKRQTWQALAEIYGEVKRDAGQGS
ncbi:hypothetical protein NYE69_28090 [Paenibacillus sp. FSL R5-0527]|uniref:hypothetical protein n=1 Tax=Paenibacillus sp. FSL R5-0527 TaxID=2975321 RepID=UPI00097AFF69|nr:hypothetical protein BK140_11295 [Paenibacillus macerans]